jgi:hypothetical protein
LVKAPRRALEVGTDLARRLAGLPNALPQGVRDEIAESVRRLSSVRSVKGARRAVSEEVERLFVAVIPMLATRPIPLRGWQARVAAGTAGGAAAAVEQAEEIAAALSWGGAVPAAPVVAGAVLTGWVLELWIGVSARVNQVQAAGRVVDPDLLSQELAGAVIGDFSAVGRDGLPKVVRAVAAKAVERWAAGLVPGVGIVFDSYVAQKTVAAILRRPVTAYPLAAPPEPALPGPPPDRRLATGRPRRWRPVLRRRAASSPVGTSGQKLTP